MQVRLQELFRDRKAALEVTQKHMETHYEHILQVGEGESQGIIAFSSVFLTCAVHVGKLHGDH